MLKKFAYISLIVLLLVYSSGITVYKHYCGSKYIKQTVNIIPHKCCKGTCKSCHNTVKQFKIIDNYESDKASFNFKNEISKIFSLSDFSTLLLSIIFPSNNTNHLFYKVKICENRSAKDDTSSFLQVFRL